MSKPRKVQAAWVLHRPGHGHLPGPDRSRREGGHAGPEHRHLPEQHLLQGHHRRLRQPSTKTLDTSQTKVSNLEAQLAQARGDRDQAYLAAEDAHGAAAKAVEKVSVTPADVQSYGFDVEFDVVKTGARPAGGDPGGVQPHDEDDSTSARRATRLASTGSGASWRSAPIPSARPPTTASTATASGARSPGFAPGTYWIHAATSVAGGRSDWFGPVAVIGSSRRRARGRGPRGQGPPWKTASVAGTVPAFLPEDGVHRRARPVYSGADAHCGSRHRPLSSRRSRRSCSSHRASRARASPDVDRAWRSPRCTPRRRHNRACSSSRQARTRR